MTLVALGSSSENSRTLDNLRELFNRTKNRLFKIPAEFQQNSGFSSLPLNGLEVKSNKEKQTENTFTSLCHCC